ncbi:MAG TPA: DNA recombination protein RmuC [Dehalococcoidia bacterium]|nr:DNA recombination protein RmuC [Dehalococcoidia bacterium]
MDYMPYIITFVGGLVLGAILTIVITRVIRPYYRQDLSSITAELEKNVASLSRSSLEFTSGQLLQLADAKLEQHTALTDQNLETKKQLIDQTLHDVKNNLSNMEQLVMKLEKDRQGKFAELETQLRENARQTGLLQQTTGKLALALAGSKARGQWGERMAEDILRLSGFIEGVNYVKQKTLEGTSSRPDFTFLLPQGLKLNMDIKFPIDNYIRCLETESETDSQTYKAQFLKDARNRIKEVTSREYINPDAKTVDYVLVFIPNEQVYRFINENDYTIIDDALKNRVVLCSPLTLYAILAIIRQAIDNFNLEKTASEMLGHLNDFKKQWEKFTESMSKMGKKLKEAQDEYTNLISTRRMQLDRPLRKIEELRALKDFPESSPEEEEEVQETEVQRQDEPDELPPATDDTVENPAESSQQQDI